MLQPWPCVCVSLCACVCMHACAHACSGLTQPLGTCIPGLVDLFLGGLTSKMSRKGCHVGGRLWAQDPAELHQLSALRGSDFSVRVGDTERQYVWRLLKVFSYWRSCSRWVRCEKWGCQPFSANALTRDPLVWSHLLFLSFFTCLSVCLSILRCALIRLFMYIHVCVEARN